MLAQLLGGLFGASFIGKIALRSDMGTIWNALVGAVGGAAGGQLIGAILGKTDVNKAFDIIAIIGPFVDGALTGALFQIATGIFAKKVLNRSITKQRGSYF